MLVSGGAHHGLGWQCPLETTRAGYPESTSKRLMSFLVELLGWLQKILAC